MLQEILIGSWQRMLYSILETLTLDKPHTHQNLIYSPILQVISHQNLQNPYYYIIVMFELT